MTCICVTAVPDDLYRCVTAVPDDLHRCVTAVPDDLYRCVTAVQEELFRYVIAVPDDLHRCVTTVPDDLYVSPQSLDELCIGGILLQSSNDLCMYVRGTPPQHVSDDKVDYCSREPDDLCRYIATLPG